MIVKALVRIERADRRLGRYGVQDERSRSATRAAIIEPMSEHGRYSEQEFEALVRSALEQLPAEFQHALENVAIVVSDRGAEHHAYGMYVGLKAGGTSFFGGGGIPDEILIFRDTLVHDFGDDPQRLREKVVQTLRHEVGHHFGFDERGVRKLGL